jgi:hypothetical protein
MQGDESKCPLERFSLLKSSGLSPGMSRTAAIGASHTFFARTELLKALSSALTRAKTKWIRLRI